MANWCNVRLTVFGNPATVSRFIASAKRRSSGVFSPDMLCGESRDLSADRVKTRDGRTEKTYYFQVRNDDGRRHFRSLSSRWPRLRFMGVYGDPNCDEYGGYLIERGRSRTYVVPEERWLNLLGKHGYVDEPPEKDEDENEWRFWEAGFEAMDLAEAYWRARLDARPDGRRGASRSRANARLGTGRKRAKRPRR